MAAVFRQENHPRNLWTCFERCKDQPLHLTFVTVLFFLGFFGPLLIIVFCSGQIIGILLKGRWRAIPAAKKHCRHSNVKHGRVHRPLHTDPRRLCGELFLLRTCKLDVALPPRTFIFTCLRVDFLHKLLPGFN